MKPSYILAFALAVIFFGLAVFTLPPKRAFPHEALNGMKFHPMCCNGNAVNGDCHHIPTSAVRAMTDGYEVTLKPGDHPLVTKPHVFFVAYKDVRRTGDDGMVPDQYYACLYPTEDTLRCLYVPPEGF